MVPSKPGTRSWARRSLAAVVLMLLVTASACGGKSDEGKTPAEACGLIDGKLVTKAAAGRNWNDVGTLYHDGKFGDGCTVLVSGDQLLLVTLIDFRGSTDAASARSKVLEERRALQRTCPESTPAPVTEDSVTTACTSEQKIDYTEWNPRRLVRLTLDLAPGSSLSTDDAVRLSEDINRRADELEK